MLYLNKKNLANITSIFILSIFVVPALSYGADPLIQCGIADASGKIANPCGFDDFIGTINRIINWIISIATIIFAISFIYGGFLYTTSAGDTGQQQKARDILWSTLKGFVIILIAWLIIYTILKQLIGSEGQSIFNFIKK